MIRLYPKEFIEYLVHFHASRDYFECHEILEDYWKRVDAGNKDSIWVAFIQLAVSSYHHRRGNFAGAKKSLEKAKKNFILKDTEINGLGLYQQSLLTLLNDRIALIDGKKAYESFILPLNDPALISQCQQLAADLGLEWENKSNLEDKALVHRHLLRDRTSVINNREKAIKLRKDSE